MPVVEIHGGHFLFLKKGTELDCVNSILKLILNI